MRGKLFRYIKIPKSSELDQIFKGFIDHSIHDMNYCLQFLLSKELHKPIGIHQMLVCNYTNDDFEKEYFQTLSDQGKVLSVSSINESVEFDLEEILTIWKGFKDFDSEKDSTGYFIQEDRNGVFFFQDTGSDFLCDFKEQFDNGDIDGILYDEIQYPTSSEKSKYIISVKLKNGLWEKFVDYTVPESLRVHRLSQI